MKFALKVVLVIPGLAFALVGNRVKALEEWSEDRHPKLSRRLAKLHEGMMNTSKDRVSAD